MMMSSRRYAHYSRFFALLLATSAASITISGCQNLTSGEDNKTIEAVTKATPAVQAVVGDYADEDYAKRAQGYDWVGISVQAVGEEEIALKVRARSDVKKPTCQFDGKATLMGQDDAHGIIFQTKVNDSTAFFQFKDDILTIDSQDKYALNYFCSGGATIAGDYQKLAGKLALN